MYETALWHPFVAALHCPGWRCALWNWFGTYLLYLSHLQDSELNELRKTIELLKKQNAAAQAAINGVINTPELSCKGNHKTRRRHPLSWYSTGCSPPAGEQETGTQAADPRARSQNADPFICLLLATAEMASVVQSSE